MTMTKFYAACLASYNNGELYGAWIDATADADEMQEQVSKMLRGSRYPNVTVEHEGRQVPSAEEWAVHDYDDADGIISDLGETSDLKAIAYRVEVAEKAEDELGDEGRAIVAAYWGNMGRDAMPKDDADAAVEAVRDAYAGEADTLKDWAEQYLEDTGQLAEVPEQWRAYIDVAAWARDLELGGDVFTVREGGVLRVFWNR
jgi:antirestriction protein